MARLQLQMLHILQATSTNTWSWWLL